MAGAAGSKTCERSEKMTRKCAVCREAFEPRQAFQTWCGIAHGIIIAAQKLAKAKTAKAAIERKADKIHRDKLKTRGQWLAEAQSIFNGYIRLRDQKAGHSCISSGLALDWTGNNVDAGHYRSRGSAPHLRFDERNVHAQSKKENRYASGNVTGYRVGLIARIGLDAVDALEADQAPRRYTVDDLKQIKTTYAAKTRELKAQA
jgi:hypothetical protein